MVLRNIVAASTVSVLALGQWVWSPWPGHAWLVLCASHAWLLVAMLFGNRHRGVPPAACALAGSCTIGLAFVESVFGHGSLLGVGWGLGLCVWLASLQAMATALGSKQLALLVETEEPSPGSGSGADTGASPGADTGAVPTASPGSSPIQTLS